MKHLTMGRTAIALLTTAVVCLSQASIASAGGGSSAIPVTCGALINQSGTYVLSGDCSVGSGVGIQILASNVTLELAGHSITGPGLSNNAGILDFSTGGHIEGPGTITRFNDGVTVSSKSVVTQVTTTSNFYGIDVSGTDNRIVDNTSLNNHIDDLYDGSPGCDSNQWHANVFTSANQTCIH